MVFFLINRFYLIAAIIYFRIFNSIDPKNKEQQDIGVPKKNAFVQNIIFCILFSCRDIFSWKKFMQKRMHMLSLLLKYYLRFTVSSQFINFMSCKNDGMYSLAINKFTINYELFPTTDVNWPFNPSSNTAHSTKRFSHNCSCQEDLHIFPLSDCRRLDN